MKRAGSGSWLEAFFLEDEVGIVWFLQKLHVIICTEHFTPEHWFICSCEVGNDLEGVLVVFFFNYWKKKQDQSLKADAFRFFNANLH